MRSNDIIDVVETSDEENRPYSPEPSRLEPEVCSECHQTKKPNDSICNVCGESCRLICTDREGKEYARVLSGLVNAVVSGGYESTPGNGHGTLDDGTNYQFSMCEFCLDWLFAQFKIPPAVNDCMGRGEVGWQPASVRVKNDEWRKRKNDFFREHDRRAALRK